MQSSAVARAKAHTKNGKTRASLKQSASLKPSDTFNVVVLYSDGGAESAKAEEILRGTGLHLYIESVTPRADEIFPTAIYRAWRYQGLDKIVILREQVDFSARSAATSKRT